MYVKRINIARPFLRGRQRSSKAFDGRVMRDSGIDHEGLAKASRYLELAHMPMEKPAGDADLDCFANWPDLAIDAEKVRRTRWKADWRKCHEKRDFERAQENPQQERHGLEAVGVLRVGGPSHREFRTPFARWHPD
jgi:hypothetical protein